MSRSREGERRMTKPINNQTGVATVTLDVFGLLRPQVAGTPERIFGHQ